MGRYTSNDIKLMQLVLSLTTLVLHKLSIYHSERLYEEGIQTVEEADRNLLERMNDNLEMPQHSINTVNSCSTGPNQLRTYCLIQS